MTPASDCTKAARPVQGKSPYGEDLGLSCSLLDPVPGKAKLGTKSCFPVCGGSQKWPNPMSREKAAAMGF